jgi:hypothetical protein|tara:strand:- start:10349 stop:10582 length:234 start_codon:yes stop_codon:yes gene_type:complete
MSINEDTIVVAGKKVPNVIDVESSTTIKHASTGKVYESEDEATSDVNDPATETTESDIKRDVAISVNKLPDIFGGTN